MNKSNGSLNFSLIICTYQRSESLSRLLESVKKQSLYPDEILIVDASLDVQTREMLKKVHLNGLKFFKVDERFRGLTKQRNYGIENVSDNIEIICFLDDDIVLEKDYFKHLIETYRIYPDAIAAGGWIIDEVKWRRIKEEQKPGYNDFMFDGYARKLGSRNVLRKRLGLLSNRPPGYMPEFSHGFSTGFLPPSGKVYPVEFFMGGVSSYKKSLFKKIGFSTYFEGYGLYEDMDFCLRASEIGQLYVNTTARCYHNHEDSGRPDYFKYGKMVIINGYYVWRLKYHSPSINAKIRWVSINILLIFIRFFNGIKNKNAIADFGGRVFSLFSLIFKKPKHS